MPTQQRIDKMTRVIRHRQPDLTVVCDNIHDPHNVSAMLRTCDAVGIDAVQLLYTYQDLPKLGKKSSASAKKWIDVVPWNEAHSLKAYLKERRHTIYATHLGVDDPVSIYDVDWTRPAAVILGNEHFGVSEEALAIADTAVYIPMFGMIQSLNVSVATAVILYEACRQRIAKGMYPCQNLTESDLARKLAAYESK